MTDWPDAPRLSETLNRLADEAHIDTHARTEVEQKLLAREAGGYTEPFALDGDHEQPTVIPIHRLTDKSRQWGRPLLISAVLLILAGIAATLLTRDAGETSTVTAGDTGTEQSTTFLDSAALPAELEYSDVCGSSPMAPSARVVTTSTGAVEIGVARSEDAVDTPDVTVITLGPSAAWHADAAAQRIETASGLTDLTVFYVPSGIDTPTAVEVLDAIWSNTCGTISYLLATGPIDEALICHRRASGPGFSGYGLIDPAAPPTACELFQPTVIAGPDLGPSVLADWRNRFGCSDPTTEVDESGNEITSYGACETTLVRVQTSATDVWSSPIAGTPPAEFLTQVVGIAN